MAKRKILLISDHMLSTSGVGTQSRFLSLGLAATGKYTIRQLGAAIKHANYETVALNQDIVIKPIDGFGTPDMIRSVLVTERPDVLLLFTDPRFFEVQWRMEDEIHQVCPIAVNHLWDGVPYPSFNAPVYDCCDLLNCINYRTYSMLKERFPEKTNYIPHALPSDIYAPMPVADRVHARQTLFGVGSEKKFIGLWVNRNARRKRPGDVIWSWKLFMDELARKHPGQEAMLVMHTDVRDPEGTDLPHVAEMVGVSKTVVFSPERVDFGMMNMLYNAVDFTLNISHSEGFGLPTLEGMMAGVPAIAVKTGGLTDQIINEDGSQNGIALDVELRSYVGSLQVPIISEDYVTHESVAGAMMQLFELGPEQRADLGASCAVNARRRFSIDSLVAEWDRTLDDLIMRWQTDRRSVYKPWTMIDV